MYWGTPCRPAESKRLGLSLAMASLHCAGPASLRRARAFSSFRISYEAHFSGAYGLVAAPTSLASSSLRRGRTTVGAAVLQHQDDATLFYPHGLKSLTPDTSIRHGVARLGTADTFREAPLPGGGSAYVKPKSLLFTFDGKQRRWDAVESLPSVGVVVYHATLDALVIVRQFRPAVYAAAVREAAEAQEAAPELWRGFTFELCAGLVDKSKPLECIASEEVLEECGYNVDPARLTSLGCSISSAGITGTKHYMYYAQVDESMRVDGAGGGLASTGECIEVLALPRRNALAFALDPALPKSPGLMFGLTWAYYHAAANDAAE